MRCVEINLDELEHDGWMVNQTRMWLASQWSVRHRADSPPEAVWLTAESLGDDDPALSANPGLPAVFVFDEALLRRLSLSSKRLVFLVDRLAELAAQHPLEIHLGDPVEVLAGRPLATTFAPVPGWRSRAAVLDVAELHPWPWLERPRSGSIASFSAWRRAADPRDDARAGSTGTVRGSPTARYDRATPQGVADMANADDIQIFEGPTDQPYTSVGPIKARVGAKTAFSKAPTPDAVNVKLRGEAAKMGANAVINVQYERGISAMSWKALTATGEAVVLQPTGTA